MEVEENNLLLRSKFTFACESCPRAAPRRSGDVVRLAMDEARRFLARVRCQDRHQGHGCRKWHRLDGLLTVAAVASVSQDHEK